MTDASLLSPSSTGRRRAAPGAPRRGPAGRVRSPFAEAALDAPQAVDSYRPRPCQSLPRLDGG